MFVGMHHFKQARLRAPNITGVTEDEARTYRVWEVSLTLRKPCTTVCQVGMGIESSLEASPVQLFITTLVDRHILLGCS